VSGGRCELGIRRLALFGETPILKAGCDILLPDLLITPPPIGERSIVVSMSVCVYVCVCMCLSVHDHIFGTTRPIFTNFSVHVAYGRGSVFFWRRSDILR